MLRHCRLSHSLSSHSLLIYRRLKHSLLGYILYSWRVHCRLDHSLLSYSLLSHC